MAVAAKTLSFPTGLTLIEGGKKDQTNTGLKSNGKPKATAADPIRDKEDIFRLQEYFLQKNQYRNYMLVTLGINFALRAGDLLQLKIGNVYEESGKVKKQFFLYEDKTNKRNRIHINEMCRNALEIYWNTLKTKNMDDPLFRSQKKSNDGKVQPLSLRQLNQILADASRELDIPDHVSSHSFRKTFANHLIRENHGDMNTLYALQYKFKHSDIRITMRYSGIEDEQVNDLHNQIGDLFSKPITAREIMEANN